MIGEWGRSHFEHKLSGGNFLIWAFIVPTAFAWHRNRGRRVAKMVAKASSRHLIGQSLYGSKY